MFKAHCKKKKSMLYLSFSFIFSFEIITDAQEGPKLYGEVPHAVHSASATVNVSHHSTARSKPGRGHRRSVRRCLPYTGNTGA